MLAAYEFKLFLGTEYVQESDRKSKTLLFCAKGACDPDGHGLFPSATVRRPLQGSCTF